MTKLVSICLVSIMVLSLFACNSEVNSDGTVRYYNTFNLTSFNATDKLKVHLFKTSGEEVIIELEKAK